MDATFTFFCTFSSKSLSGSPALHETVLTSKPRKSTKKKAKKPSEDLSNFVRNKEQLKSVKKDLSMLVTVGGKKYGVGTGIGTKVKSVKCKTQFFGKKFLGKP